VNVAESHVLRLQAAERIKGILHAAPNERLPIAHPGAGHTEMAKEELVRSRPLLKALVELAELPSEDFTQILIVAGQRRLSRIREGCHSKLTQPDEVRLGAKVYGVLPAGSGKDVKIFLQLCPVISCDQDYGRVVGHFDQHVDPEVSFLDRSLVRGEITVDHKQVNVRPDGIRGKPTTRQMSARIVYEWPTVQESSAFDLRCAVGEHLFKDCL
jgi:hypothetical protein